MNILIPHSWLLEHLDTKAAPEKIQECLSLCGPSVERIDIKNGEPVYHIEVTTNRVDMMSVRGIAREAAAILPEFGIRAKLKPLSLGAVVSNHKLDLRIENDPKLCRRILAVKLSNIKVGESPSWLAKRLRQVEQRPLLNAIDVTNYVMWEIGHPIHVFDYDRLKEKTIIVRKAREGETLTTLDGKKHALEGGEVIFEDGNGQIIDLPGIMGTSNSVVTESTKTVLLWIESIDPIRIRNASMNLAIRSQAAVLNEKAVDVELGLAAIRRAVDLMKNITEATVSSELVDIYEKRPSIAPIRVKHNLVETYMGTAIAPNKVTRILKNLGCKATYEARGATHTVTPPSRRSDDLTIPEDIIEEVTRIYGYHRLPSSLMQGGIPKTDQGIPFPLEEKVKDRLTDWGLTEVYTFSLVSRELAERSGYPYEEHLHLKNPISEDQIALRRSIVPSHLEVIRENRHSGDVQLFELANIYKPRGGAKLPEERLELVLTADRSYSSFKSLVENLLTTLYIRHQFLPVRNARMLDASRSADIVAAGRRLGVLGEIKADGLNHFDLPSPVTACILNARKLFDLAKTHPAYQPLPKHPPVIQDFTFALPGKTYVGQVIEEMTSLSRLVESVSVKEIYERNATFTVTFRHPDRSLSDTDVVPVRKKIVSSLKKHFNAKLVGEV